MDKKSLEAALFSVRRETEAVAEVLNIVNTEEFAQAVEILKTVPRIMTCASGSSGVAAKKFAHSLCCIERGAMFMPPCEAVHGGLGGLKPEDAMIMVSRGGKTAELLPIIDVCKKKGAKLIAVTEKLESPLAQAADVILKMNPGVECDHDNTMATASYVQTIAIFDALLCALIEETGYTKEQFGLIHPGGAVGARLNTK